MSLFPCMHGINYIIVTVGSLKVHSQSIEIAVPDDAAYSVYLIR